MDSLDRLYFRLRETLAGRPTDRPLTIAELYQQLVPYRAVRGELGFDELAEYEHALLRLLSGERGYAQVEVDSVREELERELRSPNPILGLYRDYAAVGVRVSRAVPVPGSGAQNGVPAGRAGAAVETRSPEPAAGATVPRSTLPPAMSRPPTAAGGTAVPGSRPAARPAPTRAPVAPTAAPKAAPSTAPTAAPTATPTATPSTAPSAAPTAAPTAETGRPSAPGPAAFGGPPPPPRPDPAAASAQCWACSETLPRGSQVRFCPFCGEGQTARTCPGCRAPLQPRWSYCPSCGTSSPRTRPAS
jgi:hypothetical protein